MNVVRAFVGPDCLQVAHVSEDRVLVSDPVRSQQVACSARDAQRHVGVVALDHGDVGVMLSPLILESGRMQRYELRFGDLSDHPSEFVLHQLV